MPPRKPRGERYPCGKLKAVGGEPPAPAILKRMQEARLREAQRPETESQVGRLLDLKLLTERQAVAAFKVARIYGAFDRLHGKRRAAVSPSYMMGRSGMDDLADERMTTEQIESREKRERNTNEAFLALQDEIPVFPRWCRDVLEQLCVDNLAVPDAALEEVRWMLDKIALLFRFPGQKGAKGGQRERIGVQPSAKAGKIRQNPSKSDAPVRETPPPVHQSPSIVPSGVENRDAWLIEARLAHPDLDDGALLELRRFALALKDRAAVDREKEDG